MALDQQGRRDEGISQIPAEALRGSRGKAEPGGAVAGEPDLPTSGFDTGPHFPGPEVNRGMGAVNTALVGSTAPPEIDTTPAGEVPRGEPFDTPDDSARMSTDPGHNDWDDIPWDTADKLERNSRTIEFDQLSTWKMMGETPPGSEGARDD